MNYSKSNTSEIHFQFLAQPSIEKYAVCNAQNITRVSLSKKFKIYIKMHKILLYYINCSTK